MAHDFCSIKTIVSDRTICQGRFSGPDPRVRFGSARRPARLGQRFAAFALRVFPASGSPAPVDVRINFDRVHYWEQLVEQGVTSEVARYRRSLRDVVGLPPAELSEHIPADPARVCIVPPSSDDSDVLALVSFVADGTRAQAGAEAPPAKRASTAPGPVAESAVDDFDLEELAELAEGFDFGDEVEQDGDGYSTDVRNGSNSASGDLDSSHDHDRPRATAEQIEAVSKQARREQNQPPFESEMAAHNALSQLVIAAQQGWGYWATGLDAECAFLLTRRTDVPRKAPTRADGLPAVWLPAAGMLSSASRSRAPFDSPMHT